MIEKFEFSPQWTHTLSHECHFTTFHALNVYFLVSTILGGYTQWVLCCCFRLWCMCWLQGKTLLYTTNLRPHNTSWIKQTLMTTFEQLKRLYIVLNETSKFVDLSETVYLFPMCSASRYNFKLDTCLCSNRFSFFLLSFQVRKATIKNEFVLRWESVRIGCLYVFILDSLRLNI